MTSINQEKILKPIVGLACTSTKIWELEKSSKETKKKKNLQANFECSLNAAHRAVNKLRKSGDPNSLSHATIPG